MGEEEFFELNDILNMIKENSIETSNNYRMKLYQRTYPEIKNSAFCRDSLKLWIDEL